MGSAGYVLWEVSLNITVHELAFCTRTALHECMVPEGTKVTFVVEATVQLLYDLSVV